MKYVESPREAKISNVKVAAKYLESPRKVPTANRENTESKYLKTIGQVRGNSVYLRKRIGVTVFVVSFPSM